MFSLDPLPPGQRDRGTKNPMDLKIIQTSGNSHKVKKGIGITKFVKGVTPSPVNLYFCLFKQPK
jgi:hypothetical protein